MKNLSDDKIQYVVLLSIRTEIQCGPEEENINSILIFSTSHRNLMWTSRRGKACSAFQRQYISQHCHTHQGDQLASISVSPNERDTRRGPEAEHFAIFLFHHHQTRARVTRGERKPRVKLARVASPFRPTDFALHQMGHRHATQTWLVLCRMQRHQKMYD